MLTYGALCELAARHGVTITENVRAFVREVEEEDLRAQGDAQDAARYRWWVNPAHDIPSSVLYSGKAVVDAYIDGELAMAKKRETA